jgi:hypothetical protein
LDFRSQASESARHSSDRLMAVGEEQKLLGNNVVFLKVSEVNICGVVKKLKNPLVLVPGEYVVLIEGANEFTLSVVHEPSPGADIVYHIPEKQVPG